VKDDSARTVLLLAGRLGEPDEVETLSSLLERLARSGITAQVLCVARGELGAGAAFRPADRRFVEVPQLASRWQRAFAARRLRFDDGLKRPDLLHVLHSSMGGLGLAIADHWQIPYLQTVEEFLAPGGCFKVGRRWCRGLVAASAPLAEDLVRSLGVPRSFLAIVPPGIAIPEESSSTTRRGVVPVIGTAGPLVAGSGIVTFLNAARRVLDAGIDAEFVISGQGDDEIDLRRRAGRLRIADRLTFAARTVVGTRFWRVLDVYCQTSLHPTVGRTLALAMAFGVPSIASDIEGLNTLIAHSETGLCVPPDDSAALARSILALLADPAGTQALGAAGRTAIRRGFDPEAEATSLASLYRSALTQDSDLARRLVTS
jgi:glycosyltransferase involved in cell wall biosynthesis